MSPNFHIQINLLWWTLRHRLSLNGMTILLLPSNKLCKPKLCKKCMQVGYCSSACQKSDWQKHKKVCKMVIKVGDTVQAKGLVGAAHLNGRSGRVIQNPDESSSRLAVLFEGDDDPSDAKLLKPDNLVVLRRP